jgi:hypothetical protein
VFGQLRQLKQQAGRIMTALQVGGRAALSAYREDMVSLSNHTYGEYSTRIARYDLFDFYDSNTVYGALNRYAEVMRQRHNLYKHIRGIYNPVHRLVALEAAKTYGGQIDWTGGLRTGAIPVEGADDRLVEAITQVLKWSNFGTQKTGFVRQGARLGDSFLKVVDDIARRRVRLELLSPRDVTECEFDAVGNIKSIVIQYDRVDENDKIYTYREEIDQAWFRTYKGKDLFAYYRDHTGELVAEWPNVFGFVPMRHVPHLQTDSNWGATSFQSSLGKINELNDLASITHDGIRKTVNPIWAVIGGRMPSGAAADTTERDEVPVVNVPLNGDIKALVASLDVPGSMSAIDKLIGEIERDMPQLSLQRIRESGGNASGVSIENSYSDASDLLIEIQGNYDQGLIAAIQMAITIGGVRSTQDRTTYAAFAGYTLDSYPNGDLDFYIKEREVFSDRLTAEAKLRILMESSATPVAAIVMRDLGYSEDDIAEVQADSERRSAAAVRGLAQAAFQQQEDDEAMIEEDTEETDSDTAE